MHVSNALSDPTEVNTPWVWCSECLWGSNVETLEHHCLTHPVGTWRLITCHLFNPIIKPVFLSVFFCVCVCFRLALPIFNEGRVNSCCGKDFVWKNKKQTNIEAQIVGNYPRLLAHWAKPNFKICCSVDSLLSLCNLTIKPKYACMFLSKANARSGQCTGYISEWIFWGKSFPVLSARFKHLGFLFDFFKRNKLQLLS